MNPISSKFCSSSKNISILLRRFKSDIEIRWVQPLRVRIHDPKKSGDLAAYTDPEPSRLRRSYQVLADTDVYKNASPAVKQLLSAEYQNNWQKFKIYKNDMINDVRRHPCDFGSSEASIAALTASIRYYQRLVLVDEYKSKSKAIRNEWKVQLQEMVSRRNGLLSHLRKSDYKRFEWLLEKLNLVYRPSPVDTRNLSRKPAMVKLVNDYCTRTKNEKLEAYKKELEKEQIEFFKEKEVILAEIEDEEKKLELNS
ncbi:small ribosomal subunit protein uS15m-like [Artemia franciscana]|uniref:Small ribosomal subunit protein uS15m n=1 Tax=Artemia franciscana TaxID=6661 RepID=A0AA88HWK7_ARTSF|nr:hypothetical protein QYM36_010200 [Artemia franciscana]